MDVCLQSLQLVVLAGYQPDETEPQQQPEARLIYLNAAEMGCVVEEPDLPEATTLPDTTTAAPPTAEKSYDVTGTPLTLAEILAQALKKRTVHVIGLCQSRRPVPTTRRIQVWEQDRSKRTRERGGRIRDSGPRQQQAALSRLLQLPH